MAYCGLCGQKISRREVYKYKYKDYCEFCFNIFNIKDGKDYFSRFKAKKNPEIPEQFRRFELEENNFVEPQLFKPFSPELIQTGQLGGKVLINKKDNTIFERVIFRRGKEKSKIVQLIKSKCIHSELHFEYRWMFCEYIVEIKVTSSDKSFEEECKIEPTEQEWKKAVAYGTNRNLKVIKFSENFREYKSAQINIPVIISNEDKSKIYCLVGSDDYLKERAENYFGNVHQKLEKIFEKTKTNLPIEDIESNKKADLDVKLPYEREIKEILKYNSVFSTMVNDKERFITKFALDYPDLVDHMERTKKDLEIIKTEEKKRFEQWKKNKK